MSRHQAQKPRTRLNEVLKLERSEVGDLAKSVFRPSGGEIILSILAHLAYIDRKLDDQDSAIAALLPEFEKSEVAGGSGYLIGAYFSQDYAGIDPTQF